MRDQRRITRMMDKMIVLWGRYPDMRFGQFVYNLFDKYLQANGGSSYSIVTMYYSEDEEFEEFLDKMVRMG